MIETHNLIKHFVNQKNQPVMEELKKFPNGNPTIIKAVKKLNKLRPWPHLLVKLEAANPQNKWKLPQNTSNKFS